MRLGLTLEQGRDHLLNAWWIAAAPGMFPFLLALSVGIDGDHFPDRLDPFAPRR